ncbi:MAG: hypothetical protein WBD45_24390 [Terriglobales bacterium]
MKYETPEMTALTPAINAIESLVGKDLMTGILDSQNHPNETTGVYADWE